MVCRRIVTKKKGGGGKKSSGDKEGALTRVADSIDEPSRVLHSRGRTSHVLRAGPSDGTVFYAAPIHRLMLFTCRGRGDVTGVF